MRKEDYLNILKTRLHNFLDKSAYPEGEITFQQDGDPKHTTKIVKEWLAKQNFNLIENLWSILKRLLGQYQSAPCNLDDLWKRVEIEFRKKLYRT